MPGPVTGLAVGYAPAVNGRTFPADSPLLQLDHILTGRGVRARDGQVLPAAGSDHLPIRASLRVV
jgi:endonuclease/exonuclease/phosphatase family metal-dependent hydrolase